MIYLNNISKWEAGSRGGTYLKIEKGDDPIVLTGNRFVLIHVSTIRMCNKTTTKACLFQQNLVLGFIAKTVSESNRKVLFRK